MKLAHPDMHFMVDISENCFPVLVLEQAALYHKYIMELCSQIENGIGAFVLSNDWKPMALDKTSVIITDLFHLQLNGKKETNALYKNLANLAVSEKHHLKTTVLEEKVLSWIMDLEFDLPCSVSHNTSVDIGMLLKAGGIKYDDNVVDLTELLCDPTLPL